MPDILQLYSAAVYTKVQSICRASEREKEDGGEKHIQQTKTT